MKPRLATAFILVMVGPVAGTGAGESGARLADLETLRSRLAELRSRLDSRRKSLGELRRAHEAEVEASRERRVTLAEQAVQLELRRQRLQRELGELDVQSREARRRDAESKQAWSKVRESAIVLAEQLGLHLRELPGHGAGRTAVKIESVVQALKGKEPSAGYRQLAGAIDQLDSEAQSVTVKPVELRTATGRLEKVDLLSVGHVGFAYRAGGRIGVAFASPADASGYRWSEDVPGDLIARWRQAYEAVSTGKTEKTGKSGMTGMITVPVDVTGRMRRATALDRPELRELFAAGGPVMWPLAVVAALCLLLLAERYWTLYVQNSCDTALSRKVIDAIRRGDPDRAQDLARRRSSSVARVLAALLSRRHAGQHAMEDSVQEQLLYELPRLNRFLRGISILAAVAPLLGLLGTVTGIIETFTVIRAVGNTAPGLMAGGISEALLTTATGLTIAIPVVLLGGVMRARVDRILAESEEQAASVLNVLAHDRLQPSVEAEGDDA